MAVLRFWHDPCLIHPTSLKLTRGIWGPHSRIRDPTSRRTPGSPRQFLSAPLRIFKSQPLFLPLREFASLRKRKNLAKALGPRKVALQRAGSLTALLFP